MNGNQRTEGVPLCGDPEMYKGQNYVFIEKEQKITYGLRARESPSGGLTETTWKSPGFCYSSIVIFTSVEITSVASEKLKGRPRPCDLCNTISSYGIRKK